MELTSKSRFLISALAVVATLIFLVNTSFAGTGVELPKGSRIPIIVERLPPDAISLGLTEDFIRSKVELQLRRNGIHPEDASNTGTKDHYIYIRISVIGRAFLWEVEFRRHVTYTVSGKVFIKVFAATFAESSVGTHVGKVDYIINSMLSNGVDVLSNEILKSWQ